MSKSASRHAQGKTYGDMAQNHWEEIGALKLEAESTRFYLNTTHTRSLDDMVREMQRGMQGVLACTLLTYVAILV